MKIIKSLKVCRRTKSPTLIWWKKNQAKYIGVQPSRKYIGEEYAHIVSTDEDPGSHIESFAVINLRGVPTNKKYHMFYRHAILQRTYIGVWTINK
jgi:hypothetical protein